VAIADRYLLGMQLFLGLEHTQQEFYTQSSGYLHGGGLLQAYLLLPSLQFFRLHSAKAKGTIFALATLATGEIFRIMAENLTGLTMVTLE